MHRMIAAGAALLSLAGAASAETRNLAGFDSVQAQGRFRVEVAVGPEFLVTVDGPDAQRIRTSVDDGTLKIEPMRRPWFGEPRYDAVVHVTLPRLEGLAAARGASLTAVAGGDCPDFSAAAAMGAELRVEGLECGSVDAAAAMGAILQLAGACRTLDVNAAMGGSVEAGALHCREVDASAAMGGEIQAYAEQSYDAAASMGGAISIAGEGRVGERSAVMGGEITERH